MDNPRHDPCVVTLYFYTGGTGGPQVSRPLLPLKVVDYLFRTESASTLSVTGPLHTP